VPETIREIFKRKTVRVSFQRTMGLFGATTLGIGALMGAGIYVLIGLAAGRAGPSAWLSYLICGLLTLLTVLMFGELARRVPITGGGYAYVYNALGSFGGFITGWLLALGTIFACAMYATGFSYYLFSILAHPFPEMAEKSMAALIVVLLSGVNFYGTKGGSRLQTLLTWGNLLLLAVLILFALPKAQAGLLKPMFPRGATGVWEAIAIIYVSFFGYQLIANNAEEIIEPRKTIPRAMLLAMGVSLTFYVAVAVVSVMVIPWDTLATTKAPLVAVALNGIGRFGWLLIGLGGVLASAAALNSTLLSQARQIFAMGKDGFVPAILGRIHETHRTPVAALCAGGMATIAAIVLGDLTFIVKSANFCFIVSLLPVSVALRRLYRLPEYRDDLPPAWRRYIPEAAMLANLVLLLTLDWVSIGFGLQLTATGVLVYWAYSRKREIRSRTGLSLILSEERKALLFAGPRILVPMANPETQQALMAISESLISGPRGEIVALTVEEVPDQIDFHSALAEVKSPLEILERTTQSSMPRRVRVRPVLRLSRSVSKGIIHAAEAEDCSLIVMGYAGEESPKSMQLMHDVLEHARTDTILFKQKGEFAPKRIAASLGGSKNLHLIVRLAGAMADRFGGDITFLNVLPANYTAEQRAHSDGILVDAIKRHMGRALYRIEVASSDEPLEFLIRRSSAFDLLIVGTTKVGFLERAAIGPFSSQIVTRSQCSVAVVRVVPAVKRLLPG
jgi:APA family basic amino acid/polyamine antiporter